MVDLIVSGVDVLPLHLRSVRPSLITDQSTRETNRTTYRITNGEHKPLTPGAVVAATVLGLRRNTGGYHVIHLETLAAESTNEGGPPSWLGNKILFDLDLIPWILIADQ